MQTVSEFLRFYHSRRLHAIVWRYLDDEDNLVFYWPDCAARDRRRRRLKLV